MKALNTAKHIVIQVALILVIAIMIVADVLCNEFYLVISSNLHQITYKTETVDDGTEVDSEYYKSEFNYDPVSRRNAQREFSLQVQSEGAVLLKNAGLRSLNRAT